MRITWFAHVYTNCQGNISPSIAFLLFLMLMLLTNDALVFRFIFGRFSYLMKQTKNRANDRNPYKYIFGRKYRIFRPTNRLQLFLQITFSQNRFCTDCWIFDRMVSIIVIQFAVNDVSHFTKLLVVGLVFAICWWQWAKGRQLNIITIWLHSNVQNE